MQSIIVDDHGTKLAYLDSGVPQPADNDYTTIFAVHGMVFTTPIFEKVMSLANVSNIRFVGINRRDYPGSTPLGTEDKAVLASGSEDEKAAFLKSRGLEVANFVDRFILSNHVPTLSSDGKRGGFALLGWSLGCTFALAAVANIDALPAASQLRWQSNMRALVLHEAPTVAIGSPLPPKAWSPQIDHSIPAEDRDPLFTQWITSYFKHGDLSTRDPNVLTYVVPATFRAPSIFRMSDKEIGKIVHEPPASGSEMLLMHCTVTQINASYKKACFDPSIRRLLPKMKVTAFTGDVTCWCSLSAHWAMEDDDKAHGGGFIDLEIIQGISHFAQWDEPAVILKVYTEAL
ncbi:hypothetical protein OH77DRAFT_1426430 [Trametes cingulata]|nr:hypothetical protein OH77DRAFT_1426430 [Trametes cingulata]